ncbi:WD40/YVTN/BNR-like repeat-containing protein [Pseudomonas sp. GCM10022186]|uniref:WD40/YVTN/BNR-like repeat-containing protein n=1 Tax=Pseudomonas sp. GCM10022186 TaxID=3252650 RepID=UPI00360FE370
MRQLAGALVICLAASFEPAYQALAQGFADPLDTPALLHREALDRLPVQALASLGGDKLIAVGMRGVILLSEDGGSHWRQVQVPVGSDLIDLSFVSSQQGWVVGQDGVILASSDGGDTWTKQLDGRQALDQLTRYYRENAGLDEQVRDGFVQQLETNLGTGPVLPFLSVHFSSATNGLASGPFGMLVASEDGGQHWRPALHEIDNPDFLHLNAIGQVGDQLFIASEQGVVFKADVRERRFRPVATGHVGSFFSIAGHGDVVLAGGLGGVLYASHDRGESWAALSTPLTQLVTRIEFDPQAQRFIAISSGGEVLSIAADLHESSLRQARAPMLYTDVASLPGRLVFASIQGLTRDATDKLQSQEGEQ